MQTTPGATRIGVIYPKGSEATLTDNLDGKPYGRPNDLVVSKSGAVYFVPPGGKAVQMATDVARPNGIMLSPDEKTLYVNNTNGEYIVAFDVAADGKTSNRRSFAKYATVNKTPAGLPNSGAEHRLCRPRQENPLHRRPGLGIQGAPADRRLRRPREVGRGLARIPSKHGSPCHRGRNCRVLGVFAPGPAPDIQTR